MRFALELLGISDIRHRNDKISKEFLWGDESICNSALVESPFHLLVWLTVQDDIIASAKKPVLPSFLFV
jgi:hypothetical protein